MYYKCFGMRMWTKWMCDGFCFGFCRQIYLTWRHFLSYAWSSNIPNKQRLQRYKPGNWSEDQQTIDCWVVSIYYDHWLADISLCADAIEKERNVLVLLESTYECNKQMNKLLTRAINVLKKNRIYTRMLPHGSSSVPVTAGTECL